MSNLRTCFMEKRLAADKVATLKAVGVEFDGLKAQVIREQHEAQGKGRETEDEFEAKLEELKEYECRHGAILCRVLAGIPVAVVRLYLTTAVAVVRLCCLVRLSVSLGSLAAVLLTRLWMRQDTNA